METVRGNPLRYRGSGKRAWVRNGIGQLVDGHRYLCKVHALEAELMGCCAGPYAALDENERHVPCCHKEQGIHPRRWLAHSDRH